MKKIFLFALSIAFTTIVGAQVKNPVEFKYEAKPKEGGYEVVITALVKKPWHIYSQNTGKSGPVPTEIKFAPNPLIKLIGTPKETGKLEKVYDNAFHTDVLFYSNSVAFTQEVKVKAVIKTNITGTIEYMVCNEDQCLPPTKKSFDIKLQ